MVSVNFYISTDKSKLDLKMIHNYLSTVSYWGQGRSLERVTKSIDNSLCYGLFNEEDIQIGFARVVTDYSVFAWILDLFVLDEYQRNGGGKMLMNSIMSHPDLQDLHRWGLGTRDAHRLYEQYGFESLKKPDLLMEKVDIRGEHELK